jgi:radical SAM superfamily enzyme YgiQ (UPF0313 family)
MKVLLIYPGLVEGFGSYFRGSDWFNHGVGIISAVLKQHNHEVNYLDFRKLTGWKEVESKINVIEFDVALISVATVDFEAAKITAGILKKCKPSARIIVGGPHPSLMTEQTAAVSQFDHIFTHEAEVTLPQILKCLDDAPRIIKGEMPVDLDSLPFVDKSFATDGETPWYPGLPRPFFTITGSRGCLYHCTFCQPAERAIFGNKVRKRSVSNILDELENLASKYNMQSFMIHDDCFTQYYEWADEFSREKVKRGLVQPFVCQSRADIICKRPDLMERLRDAGLAWVLIGFESGSDRVLSYLKKGATVEQNIEAARICKGLGIKILANYMFGIPTETKEEMLMTFNMIKKIDPDQHSPAVFTPAPGSELYDYCNNNNLILIDSSSGYQRTPLSGAKIKGVDYKVVDSLIYRSMNGELKGRLLHSTARLRRLLKSVLKKFSKR